MTITMFMMMKSKLRKAFPSIEIWPKKQNKYSKKDEESWVYSDVEKRVYNFPSELYRNSPLSDTNDENEEKMFDQCPRERLFRTKLIVHSRYYEIIKFKLKRH